MFTGQGMLHLGQDLQMAPLALRTRPYLPHPILHSYYWNMEKWDLSVNKLLF